MALLAEPAHAWPPRTRAATAYSSGYLAPYYPPGPIYSSNYPTTSYYPGYYVVSPMVPASYYPSYYTVYDVPLSTTSIPRYFHALPPPSSDEFSSERWRR